MSVPFASEARWKSFVRKVRTRHNGWVRLRDWTGTLTLLVIAPGTFVAFCWWLVLPSAPEAVDCMDPANARLCRRCTAEQFKVVSAEVDLCDRGTNFVDGVAACISEAMFRNCDALPIPSAGARP